MGLELKVSQNQKVSQNFIQQVTILQMNAQELSNFIEELELENPLVDTEERQPGDAEKEKLQKLEWLAGFDEQNRIYYQEDREDSDSGDFLNLGKYEEDSLEDILMMQVIGRTDSQLEREVLEYLIKCLDNRGYFTDSIADTAVRLGITEEVIRHCLDILKSLEPIGIGAQSLSECLLIQLKHMEKEQEYSVEKAIVCNYLEMIGKNQLHNIAKNLGEPIQRVNQAVSVIKTLNPKPANGYGHRDNVHYVKPDVIVISQQEGFEIIVDEFSYPELRINGSYMRLLRSGECSQEVEKYISDKARQIEQVQHCISKRNDTLLKLTRLLIEHQREFFLKGSGNLRPLKMQEMADYMAVHESTVSRAVKEKYLQCTWGIFPMEYFFSKTQFGNQNSDGLATDQIKVILKRLIDEENKTKPLSDQKLAEQMNIQGIEISRRTVAKYREGMGIPDCRGRKRFDV